MDPSKAESKDWIKHFWTNCNKEKSENHDLWSRVSEMVGYLSGEEGRQAVPVGADCTLSTLTIPTGGGSVVGPAEASSADEPARPVRRVVCSPDLPVGFQPPAAAPPLVQSSTTVTTPATVTPAASPQKPIIAADSTAETLQCPTCQKSFASRTAFQAHLKTHKDGEDPYQCNFCGKTFAVPARLTRHYRTHTGEKPYHCEYCTKSFSVKENLSVHRRIHTKERPYKCDICERAFEHSGKLHRHMRIHTGERPHKCAVCNKTFIQSGQLVIHMRTHTGEKPYVCKDCGKGFTCSKQLKVHNRTHSGEKPYSCDICGKSFGYNHVLKLHQVAHYGEKVYKCTICNQTFASKKTMESHIKSHSENGRTEENGQPSETESSCASSASDKENKTGSGRVTALATTPTATTAPGSATSYPNIRELCGYLYKNEKPGGLNPALLAAVAVASGEDGDGSDYQPSPDHILETPGFGVTEPVVYLIPEPVASIQRRSPTAAVAPPPTLPRSDLLRINGNNHRAPSTVASDDEVDPLLTPPCSNPVSPAASSSPEPHDIREVVILPHRKRSKAILQSMESDARADAPIRYSSVIHYAKAS